MRRLVDYVIEGGVHGVLAFASNSEFYGVEPEEQQRGLKVIIDQVSGRVPVYMGIGSITTRECIKTAIMAEKEGANAVSVLAPMFVSPNEDELYEHFAAIAKSVSVPVILYNNPGKVGYSMSTNLVVRLSKIPNIVGMKDSSGNMTLTAEYIRLTRDRNFKIFAGKDTMILSSLVYGAAGCVASTANIVPRLVVEIYEKFKAKDIEGSLEAQYKLNPFRMVFDKASFPVATKVAANLIGLNLGAPIRPNKDCSDEIKEQLKKTLQDIGVI
jgi:4-hydroxy-tetrahydrodipicolinate synthase